MSIIASGDSQTPSPIRGSLSLQRLIRMLKSTQSEMLALNQVYEQAAELDKYKSAAFP